MKTPSSWGEMYTQVLCGFQYSAPAESTHPLFQCLSFLTVGWRYPLADWKKNYTYSIGSLSHRTWDRLSSVVFSIELAVLSNLSFIGLFDGGLQCKFIRTFSIRLYRANEPCSVEKNRRGIFFLNYYGNRDSWNVRTFAFNWWRIAFS